MAAQSSSWLEAPQAQCYAERKLLAKFSCSVMGAKWSKIDALVQIFQVAFEVVKNSIGIGPGSCSTHHFLIWLGESTTKCKGTTHVVGDCHIVPNPDFKNAGMRKKGRQSILNY